MTVHQSPLSVPLFDQTPSNPQYTRGCHAKFSNVVVQAVLQLHRPSNSNLDCDRYFAQIDILHVNIATVTPGPVMTFILVIVVRGKCHLALSLLLIRTFAHSIPPKNSKL